MARIRRIAVSLFAAFSAAAALAETATYRIELSNGHRVLSMDRPVTRGTVLTFHPHPAGALTGVPVEMVVRVVSDGATVKPATLTVRAPRLAGGPASTAGGPTPGLDPGEILVLGPTGDGIAPAPSDEAGAAASAPNAGMNSGVGYGGGINPNLVNPNVPIDPNNTVIGTDGLPRVASSTDLSRAQAAQTPVGPNGFPTTPSGAATVIGPNGTPTLAPGVPGSGTPAIGPNGTPVIGTGAPPTVIGPNGTPVLAPSGQPVSSQPVIGPNGTPVLAQPGQPGSGPPVIGPNGTPVLAQPGQPGGAPPATAPNGTPASAAPSGGAASSAGAPPGGNS